MFLVTIFICKQTLANFITVNTVDKETMKPKKCHYKHKLRQLVMTLTRHMLKRLLTSLTLMTTIVRPSKFSCSNNICESHCDKAS